MKHKKYYPLLLIISFVIFTNIVYAPWSTLGTGYAITSNYHGIDVFPGTPITITAGTLDSNVMNVTFRWHMPNDTVRWEETVPVTANGTVDQWNNGTSAPVLCAQSTRVPDVLGDWGVQAFFQDSTGKEKADLNNVIKIKATSFNVVPEIPLLGTIGSIAAMLLGFKFFTARKQHHKNQ